MSKRGFVRGARKPAPMVPPVRVAVAPPLALPEREPRNILLMIALPALLVGIIGTLVVMYTSGVRSLQSGFFPMMGLAGFGALMFSGRFGRGRRISWGEQEKQRRVYLRQLDEDRDEVQRAAQDQKRSQLFVHGDPQNLDTVIGGPRMWERRPGDSDFLDVRLGIGVQQASDAAVSLQWPEVPIGEELEPVTGGALRDFILEQSKIRGIGKVLNLRSKPGFSFIGRRSRRAAQYRAFDPVFAGCLPQPERRQGHGGHPASRALVVAGVAATQSARRNVRRVWLAPVGVHLAHRVRRSARRRTAPQGPWTMGATRRYQPDVHALGDGDPGLDPRPALGDCRRQRRDP